MNCARARAEIGQTLLEKNSRVEEVCVELQQAVKERDAQIRRLEKVWLPVGLLA